MKLFLCEIPEKNLNFINFLLKKGYILADENYDVWLSNSRGNVYSCNHTTYNPFGSSNDRKKFWDFSWHEMGYYDLPAIIDFILDETDQEKLQFIGHSQV